MSGFTTAGATNSTGLSKDDEEKSFVSIDLGGAVRVDVKDGRIIRTRPLIFGEDDKKSKSWVIRAGGTELTPPRRVNVAQYTLASKQRLDHESRILYPMKRVDFDPNSPDRKTEQRGKSGYVRITWEEALDIVASEIKRIRSRYGAAAVTALASSHQMWGNFNSYHCSFERFFNTLGYTPVFNNPDSWEGWIWGAAHAYGFYWRLGIPDQYDLLEDALKNSELIVYWASDPESDHATYGGQESAMWRRWLKQLGKRQIMIDPFCNYTAAVYADKWIAPRPGTDSALALAIAYTWLKEGTYDKEYVKTHTFGFEKWVDYVTGKEDGVPKTPEWSAPITGVPARTARSLAREWASKKAMLAPGTRGGYGGAARAAYGHEWTRMLVILLAMQGYGKPGVNLWSTTTGAPMAEEFKFQGYALGGMAIPGVAKKNPLNPVKQRLYRLLVPEAFLSNDPLHWRGEGFNGQSLKQQFKPYTYPLPSPDGARVKMLYRHGASYIGSMPESNRWVKMYQSPNMEFAVCQTPWFEGEAKFADIILPACTNFERADIGELCNGDGYSPHSFTSVSHRIIMYMSKCIEPMGESKPDYEIFAMLASKLGIGQEFTEGNTVDDWLRKIYEVSDMPKVMKWDDFKKKGYYVVPFPDRHVDHRAMGSFYATGKGLSTASGKIECYSQSLAEFDPNDKERPPVPHYIQSWESVTSELAKKYPLQIVIPHPRFSFHTQYDMKCPWLSEVFHHRAFKDGYFWWPVRIHPRDAAARNIKDGDIVKVFNDRGTVLCIAQVTERITPGVVHSYESSSNYDPVEKGTPGSVDRGGCVNLLSPRRMMSKNASGFAPNSTLVDIAKWDGGTSASKE